MQTISLYRFLNLIDGSWRNAVYVECGNCPYDQQGCEDHLLAIDHDGTPLLYSVRCFCRETGESIDKTECAAILHRSCFEQLYKRWLIWNVPNSYCCHIRQLSQRPEPEIQKKLTALEVFL